MATVVITAVSGHQRTGCPLCALCSVYSHVEAQFNYCVNSTFITGCAHWFYYLWIKGLNNV